MSTLVEMRALKKNFGGIKALQDVDLEITAGEIHGLLGENGAGKSTLMRILCGLEIPDEGMIRVEGSEAAIHKPADAQALGIGMIPQELILIDGMSVTENIFLGYEKCSRFGLLDQKQMRTKAHELLDSLGSGDIDPDIFIGLLPKAEQQIVAIARRIIQGGKVFIMDEPTSALTEKETEKLFTVIRTICGEGNAVVFISHRLEEVLEICSRFTILRDGKNVASIPNGPEVTKRDLIACMIGNDIEEEFPHTVTEPGDKVLEVKNLSFATSQGREVKDVNFHVRAGEVVGITGLVGVGKTELSQTLMGLRRSTGGSILIGGKEKKIHSPVKAVRNGLGYVTEDRRGEGLVLGLRSLYNMTLGSLARIVRGIVIKLRYEKKIGLDYASRLNMKPEYINLEARKLSGGNQQKVVVIRQMMGDADVILFDEPTKGIDVGAKAEIARLISSLSGERKGICIFSSEPREILGVSDRIYVLNNQGFVGPYERGDLDYKQLMALEFGESRTTGV
ncbi:MAG: sugar ABC transporter ATP-binding protein [Sediminispirochaetaceae bacterium]